MTVITKIQAVNRVFNAVLDILWVALDRGMVVRRVSFVLMLYISTRFIIWAQAFAVAAPVEGVSAADKALLIGAIGVPLSALQGYLFKLYADGRGHDDHTGSPTPIVPKSDDPPTDVTPSARRV